MPEDEYSCMTDLENKIYTTIVVGAYHRFEVLVANIVDATGLSIPSIRKVLINLENKGIVRESSSAQTEGAKAYSPIKNGVDIPPRHGFELMPLSKWLKLWNQDDVEL